MNNSRLWMTWMNLGHKLKALNVMNNSEVWMRWAAPSHELRALDSMNNLGLWMAWATQGKKLRTLDAINNIELWMIWTIWDLVSKVLLDLWTVRAFGSHDRLQVMSSKLQMLSTTHICGWNEWVTISCAQASRFYEQLRVVDDMNDSRSWAQGSRCYEKLRVMVDMNNLGSLAKGSKFY